MPRCLVSLSETTVAQAVSLRLGPEEQLDGVMSRALNALATTPHPPATSSFIPVTPQPTEPTVDAAHSVTPMPVREKARRSPGSQPARPFSRPQPPADRRQSAGLFAYSLRVHC
jgi:hypothetical protein